MITTANESLSRAVWEQLGESPQRSSPTRRSAAYHPDIELVGRSQAFIEVMNQVERISNTNVSVLLTGEPGTGKQLVAAAIHQRSDRSDKPFVPLNCDELIEPELFGYEKESFSEADEDRRELWEEANGGTLFLNEISKTNSAFQEKLLYALQTGEIRRTGSNETLQLNVRVIASSNRNLDEEVAAGRFCSKLFDLLNAASIALPPLRDRREDIPVLVQTFAERIYALSPSVKFSSEALALLERYDWPGNIRELENAVVRAVALCDGTIRAKDLPPEVRNGEPSGQNGSDSSAAAQATNGDLVTLSEVEGRYVARVLEHTGGNKQAAARILAVDRKTLDRMIKRHHIDLPHKSLKRT